MSPADTAKPVPFKHVQPSQEFYYQRTLMMRLEDEVTLRGEPINAVALNSFSKGRLMHLDENSCVHVVEKIIAFRRNAQ